VVVAHRCFPVHSQPILNALTYELSRYGHDQKREITFCQLWSHTHPITHAHSCSLQLKKGWSNGEFKTLMPTDARDTKRSKVKGRESPSQVTNGTQLLAKLPLRSHIIFRLPKCRGFFCLCPSVCLSVCMPECMYASFQTAFYFEENFVCVNHT